MNNIKKLQTLDEIALDVYGNEFKNIQYSYQLLCIKIQKNQIKQLKLELKQQKYKLNEKT